MPRYMEVIFVGKSGDGYKTCVGAQFADDAATTAAFESLRKSDIKTAPFLIDLYEENGDIIDTIGVSGEVFTKVTGEDVLSEEEYKARDQEFWQKMQGFSDALKQKRERKNGRELRAAG